MVSYCGKEKKVYLKVRTQPTLSPAEGLNSEEFSGYPTAQQWLVLICVILQNQTSQHIQKGILRFPN